MSATPATIGYCDGSASVTVSNGTPPYTYYWDNGDTLDLATNLCYGNHWVTVTSLDSCQVTKQVFVSEQAAPECMDITLNVNNANPGMCNGSIEATISGGTAPYTYNWNYGQTTGMISGLCYGEYWVTVSDADSCSVVKSVWVVEQACMSLNVTTTPTIGSNCNGSINVEIIGGTAPYSFNWNTGQTIQNLTGLCEGYYYLTVTDSLGCVANSYPSISNSCNLYGSIDVTSVSLPGACDGAVDFIPTGGIITPLTYLWNTGATTQSLTNICEGYYYVTVTDSLGCSYETYNNVGNMCQNIYVNPITTSVSAPGNCDGLATYSVYGGTAPFSVLWSTNETGDTITGLCENYYNLTITDSVGCTQTTNFYVGNNCNVYTYPTTTPVTAPGYCDGNIKLWVTNGIAPFTYSWDNAMSGDSIFGLCEGNYTYTVTDSIGCVSSSYVTVGNNCSMYSSVNVTNESAPNKFDGSVEVLVFSGTAPYSFIWNDGATSQINDSLSSGYYYYTVTDNIGCQTSSYAYVTNSCTLYAYAQSENVSIPGNCDGKAFIFASNGVEPYSYIWTNSSVNDSIENLCEGYYGYSVTDSIGCLYIGDVNIYNNCNMYANITPTDATGPGMCDGQISTSVQGGTAPFSYIWSNSAIDPNLTGLCKNYYDVTITDAIGCKYMSGSYVGDGCGYLNVYGYAYPVSKVDTCDGSIVMEVYGENPPFTYNWSNSSTSDSLIGLCLGEYFVTVTDNLGCTSDRSFIIDESTYNECGFEVMPSIYLTALDTCTGSIYLSVYPTAGTREASSFSFNWSTGDTLNYISNLCVGNYTVTITNDYSCAQSYTYFVDKESTSSCLYLNSTFVNPTQGNCDGNINIDVSGGTPPYVFVWQIGAMFDTTAIGNYSNLCQGEYWVTVYDADSCWSSGSVYLNEEYTGTCGYSVVPTIYEANDSLCDGQISISVSGGMPPYNYTWSNAGETLPTISGLCVGEYFVTVNDMNNCSEVYSYLVPVQTASTCEIVAAATITDANNAMCNGSIDLTVTNAALPVTYIWNNGSTLQSPIGLCAGTYSVTIYDAMACSLVKVFTVGSIADTCAMTANVVTTDISCFYGNANLTVFGGTPPYTYLWNNGQLTEDLYNISVAGTYSVTVTDSKTCTTIVSATIMQTPALSATTNTSNVTCYGEYNGYIDLTVVGGKAPYMYSWNSGQVTEDLANVTVGNYIVTVTDAEGCTTTNIQQVTQPVGAFTIYTSSTNASFGTCDGAALVMPYENFTAPVSFIWNNGNTAENPIDLCAGIYSVIATDAKGCIATDTIFINENPALDTCNIQVYSTEVNANFGSCDGSASLTVINFTAPLTFAWSTGDTLKDVSGLCAGEYGVIINDAKGCYVADTIIINENPDNTCYLSVSSTSLDQSYSSCTGEINLVVENYTYPVLFEWNNGSTVQSPTGLCEGIYVVTVTDAKGCSIVDSITVGKQPLLCTLTANISNFADVTCFGGKNGYAAVIPTGGKIPYTYEWSNGVTTPYITGLSAGEYIVVVTDSKGCQAQQSIIINEATEIQINAIITDVTAVGAQDGTIDLTVNGGNSPYTFNWTNGANTEDLSGLYMGAYLVQVKDSKGCFAIDTFKVKSPSCNMSAFISSQTNVSCYGGNDGSASVLALDGDGNYSYQWTNGATTENVFNLPAGMYLVTITDGTGCIAVSSAYITQATSMSIAAVVIDALQLEEQPHIFSIGAIQLHLKLMII